MYCGGGAGSVHPGVKSPGAALVRGRCYIDVEVLRHYALEHTPVFTSFYVYYLHEEK